jgi:hypothetical protein
MSRVRKQQKPRLNQASPEPKGEPAQFALGIPGRCRELGEWNNPSVPLIQRREQNPFCQRQLTLSLTLEDKREVLPIYTRISIHQIRCGDLSAASSAEAPPGLTGHEDPRSSIFLDFDDELFRCSCIPNCQAKKIRIVNGSCCYGHPRLSFENDYARTNTRGPRVARLDAIPVGQGGRSLRGRHKKPGARADGSACQHTHRNSRSVRPCRCGFPGPGRYP